MLLSRFVLSITLLCSVTGMAQSAGEASFYLLYEQYGLGPNDRFQRKMIEVRDRQVFADLCYVLPLSKAATIDTSNLEYSITADSVIYRKAYIPADRRRCGFPYRHFGSNDG